MSNSETNSSFIVMSSPETHITSTPTVSNITSRRLRSSNRLRTPMNYSQVSTTSETVQTKITLFMDTIRNAMETLMQDHGYGRERAQTSLLDQLVSIQLHPNTIVTAVETADQSSSTQHPLASSTIHAPPLTVSDMKVFDIMRKKNVGMGHATISIAIEQTISSILNDPTSPFSSVSEILDMWTQLLQHVQPKPLTRLSMKSDPSSSSFGSPKVIHVTTETLALSQHHPVTTPAIKFMTMQQKNPPSTPVSAVEANNSKAITSSKRTKVGGKKSTKVVDVNPPPSTITISTPPSTQTRARADSAAEAVSAKMTSSSSAHLTNPGPISKGKPPLVPNTNIASSTSGSGTINASEMGRSISSVSSMSCNNKRTNMDTTRLDQQQQQESLPLICGRPSSPSTSLLTSSNKRQRRSTSMSSDN